MAYGHGGANGIFAGVPLDVPDFSENRPIG